MNLLREAFTALLSGLTHKTGNEIHWEDGDGNPITVEAVDVEKDKYIVRYYWDNGNKCWEYEYQNGQLHGKCIDWYENGNKEWEREYQNGQKHGKCIRWFENGNKYWEVEWQNGQLHGKDIRWDENGNKYWEEEYQNGQLHGKYIRWWRNGNKHWEEEYQNGQLHGKCIREAYTALLAGLTHKTGNEIHWEGENRNPITVEPVDIEKSKYIVRHYYKNGNKFWEDEYQNGQLHGKCIGWYENGNKWWEQEYQNGQLHGKYIAWYENGNKRWEREWQKGKVIK
jgi:antitoxin component YwqK of YwqJK toxin-antitoxin module